MSSGIEAFAMSLASAVAASDLRLYRRTAEETGALSADAVVTPRGSGE